MPNNPEQGRPKEQEQKPYYLTSRFPTKQAAEAPYLAVQNTLHEMACDLSAYRFLRQWEEPNEKPWYAAATAIRLMGRRPLYRARTRHTLQ